MHTEEQVHALRRYVHTTELLLLMMMMVVSPEWRRSRRTAANQLRAAVDFLLTAVATSERRLLPSMIDRSRHRFVETHHGVVISLADCRRRRAATGGLAPTTVHYRTAAERVDQLLEWRRLMQPVDGSSVHPCRHAVWIVEFVVVIVVVLQRLP